jgi:exodeoxyribonuclease VII small subunit
MSERSFEHDQSELEAIVERLERGEVELEELTALWERGETLCRRLAEDLSQAQGRIEELARRLDTDAADTTK